MYFAAQCAYVEPQIRDRLLNVLEDAGQTMQIVQWQILANNARLNSDAPIAHDTRYESVHTYV